MSKKLLGVFYFFLATNIASAMPEPTVLEFSLSHQNPHLHIDVPSKKQIDIRATGPNDYTVVDDRFVILDTYGYGISIFDNQGKFLKRISLPKNTLFNRIIRDRDNSLFVFGSTWGRNSEGSMSEQTRIVHIQNDIIVEKSTIKIKEGNILNIVSDDIGFFLIRAEEDVYGENIEINRKCISCEPKSASGITVNGILYRGKDVETGKNPSIYIDGKEVPLILKQEHIKSYVDIMQVDMDGTVWVRNPLELDDDHWVTYVWKVNHFGEISAVYRFAQDPKTPYFWDTNSHDILIGNKDNLYVMVPTKKDLQFIRLKPFSLKEMQRISQNLDKSFLLKKSFIPKPPKELLSKLISNDSVPSACRNRNEIVEAAKTYELNKTYLKDKSIENDALCLNRKTPQYLQNQKEGYYDSVSYNWGGFDSVDDFNKKMLKIGIKAGNVNLAHSPLSCSAGVDCSGFVSRVWGLSSKWGTWDIGDPKKTTEITQDQMEPGDVYVIAGDHVMMYLENGKVNGTVKVIESTAVKGLVMENTYPNDWLRKQGFKSRRAPYICKQA